MATNNVWSRVIKLITGTSSKTPIRRNSVKRGSGLGAGLWEAASDFVGGWNVSSAAPAKHSGLSGGLMMLEERIVPSSTSTTNVRRSEFTSNQATSTFTTITIPFGQPTITFSDSGTWQGVVGNPNLNPDSFLSALFFTVNRGPFQTTTPGGNNVVGNYGTSGNFTTSTVTVQAGDTIDLVAQFSPISGIGTDETTGFTFNVVQDAAPAPTLTSVSPNSAAAGSGNTTITLTGTNFFAGSTVNFAGTTITPTLNSSTSLTAIVPAASLTNPGSATVSVTTPGGTTGTQPFTITGNPVPSLGSISPTSTPVGSNNTTITLTGTNFVNGSTVNFAGTTIIPTFNSSTSLTAIVPASSLTTTGSKTVTVVNPDGSASGAQSFTVNAPTLTSVSPNSIPAGSGVTTVTLTGTNFVPGTTIATFNGLQFATLVAGTSTQITAFIPASFLVTAGVAQIGVLSSGTSSNTVPFTVTLLTITSPTPPNPTTGQPYSFQVTSSGGAVPVVYTVSSGTLPAGLFISPTGLISGTPTTAGTVPFTITATDANTRTANQPVTLIVSDPLAITTATIAPVSRGVAYSQPITTTGGRGPNAFVVTSGVLPTGLILNPGTGVISGTPTVNGPFTFAVTAGDADGRLATSPTFTGSVTDPLAVTTTTIAPPSVGVLYTQPITTTGGQGPNTFAVTSGALPNGLTINPNSGVISGTPTIAGPYTFAVTATDSVGRTAVSPTFADAVTGPLAITTTSISPISLGVPYTQPIVAVGGDGPNTFVVSAGTLPTGLTISPSTGVISGTPTVNGPYTFAVTATDADGRTATSPTFTGNVANPLAITTTAIAVPTVGQAYTQPIATTGGESPNTFAVTAGSLPMGLMLNASTGVISGTPTTIEPFTFAVTATDMAGRTAISPTFTGQVSDPLAITTATISPPSRGVPYTQPIVTTGGRGPNAFVVTSGVLPTGLTLDPNTGIISGTPTVNGPYTFAVNATDADGRVATSPTFTGTVSDPLDVTTATLPAPLNGVAYSQPIDTTGGQGPNVFAVTTGTLPAGLTLNPTTGVISGTPTTNGPYSFAVKATDSEGRTDTSPTFTGTVTSGPTGAANQPFTIPRDSATGVAVGTVQAVGNTPLKYAVTAGNGAGAFAINPDTGAITVANPGALKGLTNPTILTVTATDPQGRIATFQVPITVPEFGVPTAASPQTFNAAATSPTGTTVATAKATDPEGGSLSYALIAGNGPGAFAINTATGAITVADGAKFAGLPGPSVTLRVSATDTQGVSTEFDVVINLTRGSAPIFNGGQQFRTPKTAPAGRVLGTVVATDPDGGSLRFAIIAGNTPGAFTIDPATGRLTVANPNALAGLQGTVVTLTVQVTDSTGLITSGLVIIDLTDDFPIDQGSVTPFAVSAGPGGGNTVTVYNADGSIQFSFQPFTTGESPGGVRVAVADVTGDGTPDVVIGTGPGVRTSVRVFDGTTQATLMEIAAFEASFFGGTQVASADVNGDGKADIIVTAEVGGSGRVRVLSGLDGSVLADFFGIEDDTFRGGSHVALADINGDGVADLLVSAGIGGSSRIAAYDGNTLRPGVKPEKLFADFFAFEPSQRDGAFVTAGDVNGDGKAEVIAGGGDNGGPRVFVLDGARLMLGDVSGALANPVANFFAGNDTNRGGVRIAVKDLDGDERVDLITGAGISANPSVKVYLGKEVAAANGGSPAEDMAFDAFDGGFMNGIFVG